MAYSPLKESPCFTLKHHKAAIRQDSISSNHTACSSGFSGVVETQRSGSSGEGSGGRKNEELSKSNYTATMHERWHKANAGLPDIDKKDIVEENPVFNQLRKCAPGHQHHPEFTQSSYLRLRSLEEAFLMANYLEHPPAKEKLSIGQRIVKTVGL
jgi:hypothetical protein